MRNSSLQFPVSGDWDEYFLNKFTVPGPDRDQFLSLSPPEKFIFACF